MNTANLKKVAPRARTAFIAAIKARAAEFGITSKGVSTPTVSGDVLQVAGFTHPASIAPALKRLQQRLEHEGFENLMEQMAYTWFNRFCAIRFMELKSDEGYLEHGVRLLSHPNQPQGFEVLDRAPEVIDSLIGEGVALDKPALLDLLLAGNEQEALFRELLLGQCHRLHQAMPFLFEAIDDETELLLPSGLTRTDAFWRELVDGIPEADWQQVEVIGWLYQFYISEKKDEVIGKVVKSEDIPAATQLFTPNWIVQYLVQNSVGRHWLQTYPDSALPRAMPYFVFPGEQPIEVQDEYARFTPDSIEPESIKVLDPACGSGHILVEAYNLLYRIYEERGYRSREIPELILKHNLFGLDIDDRAAQLAGFALLMRARQDDRRLFSRELSLNIHSLQESRHLNIPKLWQALNLNADGDRGQVQDMFAVAPATLTVNDPRLSLLNDLHRRFLAAKTLGSLIEVSAEQAQAIDELCAKLQTLSISGDAMQKPAAKALLPLLCQASVLAKRYDAVIANPPYMGGKGMNNELKEFAKKQFPDSKSDLFAIFIERNLDLTTAAGVVAMITMQSWMFLSSFEALRARILGQHTILGMAHLGARGFDSIGGEVVSTAAFSLCKVNSKNYRGKYLRLVHGKSEKEKEFAAREAIKVANCGWLYQASAIDFSKVPGSPIAYWVSNQIRDAFQSGECLEGIADPRLGMSTNDNGRFLRAWHEISLDELKFGSISAVEASNSGLKWFPYNKGGSFRRWYGNQEFVINYENDGEQVKGYAAELYGSYTRTVKNIPYFFKPGLTWSLVGSGTFSLRVLPVGFVIGDAGPTCYPKDDCYELVFLLLNSKVTDQILAILNPTINFTPGVLKLFPVLRVFGPQDNRNLMWLINTSKNDWDSFEASWSFASLPPCTEP
ncbi:BREX-1 system adenine-specific DNA-methyltransferase PglX [Aeromonas caviae]|uniref:BREX-1 system adenine-specific DNA-methyltransferase PglX n=1 Tax=Aeromonas caviae TaxID=648 RepID=UPI00398A007A